MNETRKPGFAVACLVAAFVLATPAGAQDRPLELSVLVAPGATYSEIDGFDLDSTAYGLGAGWRLSEAWSLEVRGLIRENDSGSAEFEEQTFDLGLRRAIGGGEAWRPFLQAGARYRNAEANYQVVCVDDVTFPCPPLRDEREEYGPFVGGGVDWIFGRAAALRFDGRLSIYESDAAGGTEEDVDLTVGLVFRF
jgi:hypothetical protein